MIWVLWVHLTLVFDCSAEFQGHSLNRHLLQGPDLTNTLIGVLCRFRQEPVAFACDIEGMFHQVHVSEEHRDLLRFLWWDQGDTTKEPTKYRMTVHLFGVTSSPDCANLALRTAADDGKDDLGVEAASFIKENFYIDDGLRSVPTVPEATKLIKNATEMCMRGSFKLHKFMSNSKEIVESIPVESRAKEIVVSVPKTSCNLHDGYKDLPFCGNTVATGGTLIRVHPNPSS